MSADGVLSLIFFGVCAVILVLTLRTMTRNNAVARFRHSLIAEISQASQQDIRNGRFDWQWRYTAFESVSYDEMLFSRKRLVAKNFYDDTSFLHPTPLDDLIGRRA